MGTKLNPGKFDCYANAKPDEPMFVLLARDPNAWWLVILWAYQRRCVMGEEEAMVNEALHCAGAMREYCSLQGKDPYRWLDALAAQDPEFASLAKFVRECADGVH